MCIEKEEKAEEEEKRKKKERKRAHAKCLDYIGKSLWGKGSPALGLESSGQKVQYASHTL